MRAEGPQPKEPAIDSPETHLFHVAYGYEKAFLVRACQLSDEQKVALSKLDDSWKTAPIAPAPQNIDVEKALRNALIFAPRRVQPNEELLKVKAFRDSLHKKFSELLTDSQRETYQMELAARDEFRKRADAQCMVAILDNYLTLTPEQRESLTEALMELPTKDNIFFGYYFQDNGQLPSMPNELLSKHLSADQMSLLRSASMSDVLYNVFQDQIEVFGE